MLLACAGNPCYNGFVGRMLFHGRMKEMERKSANSARHFKIKFFVAVLLAVILGITASAVISVLKIKRTEEQLFETNRNRINTVIGGLEDGMAETGNMLGEIDRVYFAKLENALLYFGSPPVNYDDAFAEELASFTEVNSVAVIDGAGKKYGSFQCDTDFSDAEFSALRKTDGTTLAPEPVSSEKDGVLTRYFARKAGLMTDRILVLAIDWTKTQASLDSIMSRESVLRGMVSVDTYSVSVSLADKTFLYDPVGGLTGKSAESVFPASAFGGEYEGTVTMNGEKWCAVGREWNGEEIFVITRLTAERKSDTLLLAIVLSALIIFIGLIAVYGIVLRQSSIREGRLPSYGTIVPRKLYINFAALRKLLPIFLSGVLSVFLMTFCIQTANAVSSMAYESDFTIGEVENTYNDHREEAEFFDGIYRNSFLNKSALLVKILERNPQYLFTDSPSAGTAHLLPDGSRYAVSDHVFLKKLCETNAIETLKVYDESGQTIASSNDEWYVPLTEDSPFWPVLQDHTNSFTLETEEEEGYAQYIGMAFSYFTEEGEGAEHYVSRDEYEAHFGDGTVAKHRGVLLLRISPERLRAVRKSASLSYAAEHTTVHGTGFTLVFKDDGEHTCVYSPRGADIGKPASHVGCERGEAFLETGEMYMDMGTVAGVKGFQAYRLVDENYIVTVIPRETVFANRTNVTLTASVAAFIALLPMFLYSCLFGAKEQALYREAGAGNSPAYEEITVTLPSGKVRKIRAGAVHGDSGRVAWREKSPEQKNTFVSKLVFLLFAVVLLLLIILSRTGIYPLGAINYIFDYKWARHFNVFSLTDCAILFTFVLTAAGLLKRILYLVCSNFGSRAETLGRLFVSLIRYGSVIFSIFYGLYLFGLETAGLLASAGILSLVIGLGAQSLIQDLLAGIFIVFEGEFRVGDIVTVGDFMGQVIDIGLRTTKVEDLTKNIKIFNNSSMSGIVNMTKEVSYAIVDVGIEYGESIERVEEVLNREFVGIRERLPAILDGPIYKGVQELGESSVNIRIAALCSEGDRVQLVRDLNREILIVFKKNGINIPFPHRTVTISKEDGKEDG